MYATDTDTKQKLLAFIQTVISVTINLASQHGKTLTREEAFDIVESIVTSNYPKCAVKYLTDQEWVL